MRLSVSEIRSRAMKFAAEWANVASERAEAQSFWTDLFDVFGIRRRAVASFEEKVKNLKGAYDRIDVFYAGVMLGEHKSKGEDLSKAASQAFDYIQSLQREGRDADLPQFIVVSDFQTIVVYDLDSKDPSEPVASFKTAKLHDNIKHLGFLSGYTTKPVDPEDPINIEAVEVLGKLHDALEKGGYKGHQLERFLVRVLFCLFADDTAIFDNEEFKTLIKGSRPDGSDLGLQLARFFKVLDQDKAERPAKLPEELRELPYVNGELFKEDLGFAEFDAAMRKALVECCEFNWSRISPAVFGSLFQSIMAGESGAKKRRQIGAHYTSERDILKLVRSLFLDELQDELAACGTSKIKLEAFQTKLASLRFLDPACGCGNFLVVTYRELRELELQALLRLYGGKTDSARLLLDSLLKVDVDQMHGIEIEEWPARIAEVAMWLIDHQMNQKVGEAFGRPVRRLPLKKSAKIAHANALQIDWNTVLPAAKCSCVLGNPPFVGKQHMSGEQNADMEAVCGHIKGFALLDFVTAWYVKATAYLKGTRARAAFVSTNSICQGEQAATLWPALLKAGLKIAFAHRTFQWMSEARGKANVHVIIVGFAMFDPPGKTITEYDADEEHPTTVPAKNINPYLVDAADVVIQARTAPISPVPPIIFGSMPNDGGNLLLEDEDKAELVSREPGAAPFIRSFLGAHEFINGESRWCLWLTDKDSATVRKLPAVMERVAATKKYRERSTRPTTRELACAPTKFGEIRQPNNRFLLIPRHSSERRRFIPIGYIEPEVIAGDSCLIVPSATPYHFGVLTSEMHMAWVRQVCGRLESRYRYSNKLVYNNFPWPQDISEKQQAAVAAASEHVLAVRDTFKGQTLADLYDPLAMPKSLRDAHRDLDRAVDKCYRAQPFTSERQRVEYLFDLYQKLITPLTVPAKSSRRKLRAPG
ncbi:MAG: class I SAM-dependent DNA methyltransferase [Planctomycetes bacterium]|nr:class I SAM-dependent DNA methyltransferase [Planctomycetota bacterium]